MLIHMETRGVLQEPSTLCFEKNLLPLGSDACQVDQITWPVDPRGLPVSAFQGWDSTHMSPCLACYLGARGPA